MSSRAIDIGAEQLFYIPCDFCNIVLAVSVPCKSLFDIVTIRCGHCCNLWSVNMAAAFQSFSWQNFQAPKQDYKMINQLVGSSSNGNSARIVMRQPATIIADPPRPVNRPPEKRQRVPSAYNQFIKDEIQRIKACNPDISHREAFSTAAKNWAHFPHIHFGLMLETNNQPRSGRAEIYPRKKRTLMFSPDEIFSQLCKKNLDALRRDYLMIYF